MKNNTVILMSLFSLCATGFLSAMEEKEANIERYMGIGKKVIELATRYPNLGIETAGIKRFLSFRDECSNESSYLFCLKDVPTSDKSSLLLRDIIGQMIKRTK